MYNVLLKYTAWSIETGNTGQSGCCPSADRYGSPVRGGGSFFLFFTRKETLSYLYYYCAYMPLPPPHHMLVRLGVALNRRRTTTCAHAVHEKKRARGRNDGRADLLSRRVMPTAGWYVVRRRSCGVQNYTTCVRAFSVRDILVPLSSLFYLRNRRRRRWYFVFVNVYNNIIYLL